jgi:hypothetical protein
MDSHEIETHLRGASDAIMVLLGELKQLEGHKRGVRPSDPRFGQLATAVRDAAQSLAQLAREQEEWGRSAAVSDPRVASIAKSPNSQPLSAILARWREVERKLDAAEPGSDEATRLFGEFQMVREEYLAAFRGRLGTGES